MKFAALALCLLNLPVAVGAQDGNSPAADFFVGQYRMVGTDAKGVLVDLALRLDIAGQGLVVSTCDAPDAGSLALPGPEGDSADELRLLIQETMARTSTYQLLWPKLATRRPSRPVESWVRDELFACGNHAEDR